MVILMVVTCCLSRSLGIMKLCSCNGFCALNSCLGKCAPLLIIPFLQVPHNRQANCCTIHRHTKSSVVSSFGDAADGSPCSLAYTNCWNAAARQSSILSESLQEAGGGGWGGGRELTITSTERTPSLAVALVASCWGHQSPLQTETVAEPSPFL